MKYISPAKLTDTVANMIHECGRKAANIESATLTTVTLSCGGCGKSHVVDSSTSEAVGKHFKVERHLWSTHMNEVKIAC